MNIICIALNMMPIYELEKLAADGCTFEIEDGKITGVHEEGADGK